MILPNLEHIFPRPSGFTARLALALGLLVAKQEQFRPGGYTRPILPVSHSVIPPCGGPCYGVLKKKEAGDFQPPAIWRLFGAPTPKVSFSSPCRPPAGADFIETLPGASWPDGPGLSANRERAVILGRLRKPQGDFRGHPEPPIPGHDLQQRGPVPRVRPCQKVDERIPVSVPKPRGQFWSARISRLLRADFDTAG